MDVTKGVRSGEEGRAKKKKKKANTTFIESGIISLEVMGNSDVFSFSSIGPGMHYQGRMVL